MDVNLGLDTYLSCPTMEIQQIKSSIGLGEQPMTLILRNDIGPAAEFAARISNGDPHSRIHVRTSIFTIDGGDVDEQLVHVGIVGIVRRNHNGRRNLISVEVNSWKSMLDSPAGIPLTRRCPWTLGGPGCFLSTPMSELREKGVISAISGSRVTITGLDDHSVGAFASSIYWKWGDVQLDGCVLRIRDWNQTSPTVFRLSRRPPSDWLGQEVDVTPGCVKMPGRCEEWGNTEHFGAIARKMDNRNPFMEQPETD